MRHFKNLFQFNKFFTTLILLVFATTSGCWLVSYIVYKTYYQGNNCISAGYAYRESWIFSVVIYPDGIMQYQHFYQNLSNQNGLFVKLSSAYTGHRFTFRLLFPVIKRTKLAYNLTVHLLLPLLLLFVVIFVRLVLPVVQRNRRHSKGLCVQCGYDLRGSTSSQCSECGTEIKP